MNSALTGVRLSPSEVKFEEDGITLGVRRDGRALLDSRHIHLSVGLLPQANGSARVRTMLRETDVLCGIKFEVGAYDDASVQCSMDLGSLARADLFGPVEAQKRAERRGLELADQLVAWFENSIELPPALVPGKVKWICYLDFVILGDGGNLQDYISVACYAALSNCRVPAAVTNEDEDDFDINPDILSAKRLDVHDVSLTVTCWMIKGRVVCDPTPQEEACAECAVLCTATRLGQVTSLTKLGSGALDATVLVGQILHVVGLHAKHMFQFVDKEVAKQEQQPQQQTKSVCLSRAF